MYRDKEKKEKKYIHSSSDSSQSYRKNSHSKKNHIKDSHRNDYQYETKEKSKYAPEKKSPLNEYRVRNRENDRSPEFSRAHKNERSPLRKRSQYPDRSPEYDNRNKRPEHSKNWKDFPRDQYKNNFDKSRNGYKNKKRNSSASISSDDSLRRKKPDPYDNKTKQTRLARLELLKYEDEYSDLINKNVKENNQKDQPMSIEEIQKMELCKKLGVNPMLLEKFNEDLKATESLNAKIQLEFQENAGKNNTDQKDFVEDQDMDSMSKSMKSKSIRKAKSDTEIDPLDEYMLDLQRNNKDIQIDNTHLKVFLSSKKATNEQPAEDFLSNHSEEPSQNTSQSYLIRSFR